MTADRNILPVNGTREALFAFAQCVIDSNNDHSKAPVVISPNPFYQIYEGAALLARAEPYYVNCVEANGFLPDFDVVPADVWQRCQLVYLCSPGNPTGAILGQDTLEKLLKLADEYDFIIAADECYSEIYLDEDSPPIGLLQVAANLGRDNYRRCVVFHSLSKRSNVPGMRSGFVAGDGELIQTFLRYRTYHGCSMPLYTQMASIVAWQDEDHVRDNRALYRKKFDAVLNILEPVMKVTKPDASFYLWPETPISDTEFAAGLYSRQNITVLPGSFLSRSILAGNPGKNRIRIALVAEIDQCIEAAKRICEYIRTTCHPL
jgi:N-succinyldiaminopimelate aminotransferase